MKNIIFIAAIATSIVFASCNSNKTETQGEETEHHDEHENTNTAMLTAEQMKSIKIELGSIEKKQLTASLKANGILKVPNQNRANATASLGGVIKSILVQTGNSVSKGQTIATISNNSFITMQEEFLSISSKADLAQFGICPTKRIATRQRRSIEKFAVSRCRTENIKGSKSKFAKTVRIDRNKY